MDILNEYFEVVDEDVYYTFRGVNVVSLINTDIKNNPMYGKRVNLSKMYKRMIKDIGEYIVSEEFMVTTNSKKRHHICDKISSYTTKRYGVSFVWIYNMVYKCSVSMTNDILFEEVIKHKGGVDKIDWMWIYDNMSQFHTDNESILMYIANEILKGRIYEYFIDRYNLRTTGVKKINNKINGKERTCIVLNWDGENDVTIERFIELSQMIRNKRDWWRYMVTKGNKNKNRMDIQNYDVLLAGRNEDEVLPNRCPIDDSIILNYTGIDFSDKDLNINVCKNNDGMEEVWSPASIDRIDSTKPYSYDNVEIISNYYNTQVKNCASHSQVGKLYYYQLKKLLSKKINKELVKSMSDNELYKVFDMFSVYFKLFEIVSDNSTILHKEMVRRDKKSKLVDTKI
jgi:hypothetical protein